ncbi:hypothetical protein TSUD_200500 [Trifolium subterraneum]|nr:hypothetical protein TSUD_200500 [Trifolium subterraneum]
MAPAMWEIPISQRSVEYFLKSYESWGEDVTDVLSSRARSIVQTIFPDNPTIRRFDTLSLYYKVLEGVCRAEKKEPKILHAILTSEIFHRCLLASAAAVQITGTSSTVSKMFPADVVLKSSGITAFDLSHTITASFITHEDSFPGYFSRHLNSFKEQLLESMAWKKGSSLYNSLSLARPSLSAQINCRQLFAQSMPSSFNETMLNLEAAETKIGLFFREISMLGAVRICGMVERLQLSQRTGEDVYSLFQRILNERAHLFFNRHIDQIMLCCFYMVAQFSKLNLSFWEILHSYKQQPECRSSVFRSVFVDCPLAGNNDDGKQIIRFS